MCSSDPQLPAEANKAKCFSVACFVFSIFSMLGFGGGWSGAVGAIGGILACIASSILMCCSPKKGEMGGKFCTSAVLFFIAGILQLIMAMATLGILVSILVAVNDDSYCGKRYKDCTTSSDGCSCTSGYSGWIDSSGAETNFTNGANYCLGTTEGLCYDNSADNSAAGFESTSTRMCTDTASKDLCQSIYGTGTAVVSGVISAIMGIAIIFLSIAGILNVICGKHCLKAKKAMDQSAGVVPVTTSAATAVPVATATVVATPVA